MKGAARLPSAIYRIGTNSSRISSKVLFPYTSKPNSQQKSGANNSGLTSENILCKNISSATETNQDNENKTSPRWQIEDGSYFNRGLGAAAIATAISVSSILFYKYKKGVKAEGKFFNSF